MDKNYGQPQMSKRNLDEVHSCVVGYLKKAMEILEETAEECEGFKMRYFIPGTLGFRIKQITQSLRIIIKEVVSVIDQAKMREQRK